MNPARKWDFRFMAAADPEHTTAKNFWEDLVTAYSSYQKICSQITSDDTGFDKSQKNDTDANR
jgi:hypothetical protein